MKKKQLLFIFYVFFMAYLLFINNRAVTYDNYLTKLANHINLIPFRTIISYIKTIAYSDNTNEIRHAIINNLGNIIVFIPLGYFLKQLFNVQSIRKVIRISLIIIFSIESIQLFSLTGSFDIDDIILNTIGILLGYLLSRNKH